MADAIVVYPDGFEGGWNDDHIDTNAPAQILDIDDVGFLTALIERMIRDFNCDRSRVLVTGISNGAMMSMRLARERPELIAAIAPVVGLLPDTAHQLLLPLPVSLCLMVGTDDPLVPYDGGQIIVPGSLAPRGAVRSAEQTLSYVVEQNGCMPRPL